MDLSRFTTSSRLFKLIKQPKFSAVKALLEKEKGSLEENLIRDVIHASCPAHFNLSLFYSHNILMY